MNETGTTDLPVKSLSRSLTRRVLLLSLIGILGVASTIVLGFLLTLYQVQARIDRTNVEAVSAFDRFFLDIQSDLRATSDVLATRDDKNSALLELRIRNNAFLDVFFVSPEGVILAQRNSVGRPKQTKIDRLEWLKAPPPFGKVAIGPVRYEEQTPYVDVAVTSTDDIGLPVGLLLARVDLTELWNAALDVRVGDTGYAYIVDNAGQLVAFRNWRLLETSNTLQKLVGHTPQAIAASHLSFYTGLSGEPVLASAQPLKTVPWFAVVEQPVREAMSPFVIPALALLIAFGIVGMLLSSTIRFTRARIVSPLLALHSAVAQMANGQLKQSIEIGHNDELGQLAHSFNRMASQLQQAFDNLENRIGALKQVQAALHTKSEELDTYFTASLDLLCIADTDGYFHRLNPEWERTLGYSQTELKGKRFLDFVHPADLEATLTVMSKLNQQETVLNFENRYRCKDGSYRWIEWRSFPIGNLIYAAARDITERKRTEEALVESELKYRTLFKSMSQGFYLSQILYDQDGIPYDYSYMDVNSAFEQILGLKQEQIIGKTYLELVPPDPQSGWLDCFKRVAATGIPENYTFFSKIYNSYFEVYAFKPEEGKFSALVKDITESKLTEETLQKERALIENIMETSPVGITTVDAGGKITYANSRAVKILGLSKDEVTQTTYNAPLWHITDLSGHPFPDENLPFNLVMSNRRPVYDIQHAIQWSDGKRALLSVNAAPMLDGKGHLTGMVASIEDITERVQAEKALQGSEERYRLLFENMTSGFALHEMIYNEKGEAVDYRFLEINPAFERQTGIKAKNALGKTVCEILPGIEPGWIERYGKVALTGEPSEFEDYAEALDRYYEVRAFCPEYGKFAALFHDITERKRAEESLRESEAIFASFMEHSPVYIFFKDKELRPLRLSRNYEQMLGLPLSQLLGKTMYELFPSDLAKNIVQGDLRVLNQGRRVDVVEELGGRVYETTKFPVFKDGKPNMLAGFTVDITARKQAEDELRESEERFAALSESAFEGIVFSDKGVVIDCNEQLTAMLGYERAEIIGAQVSKFIAPESLEDVLSHIRSGSEEPYENTLLRKDGVRFLLETRAKSIPYKGKMVRVTAIRDITKRKRAEEKLSQQLDQLQLLRAIDAATISSVDLDANLRLIAQKTVEQFKIAAAAILLLNPKTRALDFAAGAGFRTDTLQFARPEISEETARRAVQERRAIHIPDLQKLDANPALTKALKDEGFVAYYGIPLIAKNQTLGVLEVFNRSPLPADPDWLSFIETLAGQVSISIDSATLFSDLQKSNTELILAYDATLEGWSFALDLRDKETEGHTLRVTEMATKLARAMGIDDDEILQVKRGALLHDIGKMGIPDAILLKPGELTDQEQVVMRKHPTYARDLLAHIEYLKPALDIPYCHHEKWDGTGYPQGIKGEQIPLTARLFAVVDVWDALCNDRPYRPAWPPQKVIEYIRAQTGTHFDPRVVEIFLRLLGEDAP